jgi:hypothetical protein
MEIEQPSLPNAPPPDTPPINASTGYAPPAAEPRRSERVPTAPERFAETIYSHWSIAEMARRDERHGRVWEEAVAQEPALAAELEKLFTRAREQTPPSATVASGGASDELEGEMARAAATTLHAALLELLGLSQTGDEMSHIWSDEAPPPALSVRAYIFTGGCVDEQSWGVLAITPPLLTWTADAADTVAVGACGLGEGQPVLEVPLVRFVGVDDDADEHDRNQLRLLQGEGDDGILFGFENEISLIAFERTLRVAVMASRATTTYPPPATTAAAAAPPAAPRATTSAPAAPSASNSHTPAPSKQPRREEPRVRKGRELREALGEISTLFVREKKKAQQELANLSVGEAPKDRTVNRRAAELRDVLFTCGGFSLTHAALDRFLNMREVKLLLDEKLQQSRAEVADAKTATAMLHAAKRFLNDMLDAKSGKTGGRLSDVERNAFWASVVSMMPRDLLENRQGRAMMRILGIPYRTVKRANTMRKELEDAGKGWVLLKTAKHYDRAELHLSIIDKWWHSDEPSCPDNQNKEQVRVYSGHGIDPATGRRGYELHDRRAQEGDDKHALSLWRKSEAAKEFAAATATPKRPDGIKVGRKLLIECRCECVKKRTASFADCKICSFVIEVPTLDQTAHQPWVIAVPGLTVPGP